MILPVRTNRSLYQDIVIALIILIAAISFVCTLLSFWALNYKIRTDYELKSQEFMTFLTQSLVSPLWDMDSENIEKICSAFARHEIVARLKVTDSTDKILFEKLSIRTTIWAQARADIVFRNQILGHVELALTPDSYRAVSLRILAASAAIMALIIISLAIGVKIILQKTLKKSLDKLIKSTIQISKGQYDVIPGISPYREIQSVFQSFKHMADAIQNRETEIAFVNRKLALHAENTPLGVIEWDPDFKVVGWNKAAEQIFGYSKDDILGKNGLDLIVPPESKSQISGIWQKLIDGNGSHVNFQKNTAKTGESKDTQWFNTLLCDQGGAPIGMASLVQDITDTKRLEIKLRQTQKIEAIGTLAGGIAHDFNNILMPLIGYAQFLEEDLPKDSPLQSHVARITQAAGRAKDLVRQILAFSRQDPQEVKPVKLQTIIDEAVRLLSASIPKTIEFKADVDPDCSMVLADSTSIHQIIMNLATNAYHAMETTGGNLSLLLRQVTLPLSAEYPSDLPPGPYALLEIKDTGEGIRPELLNKIFDPYFTTKATNKGTGLGLSVVQGIVKSCKGDIQISSQPGQGTTVQIFLPILDALGQERIPERIDFEGGKERILVVDDEKAIAELACQMLTRLGYKTSASFSSVEALATFQTDPGAVDLIITDMTMPGMTGVDLAQKARLVRPDIKIIICTGFSDQLDEDMAGQLALNGYLTKPISKQDLAYAIRQALT